MAHFRYTGFAADGSRAAGEIESHDIDAGLAELMRRGLRSVQLVPAPASAPPPDPPPPSAPAKLTTEEALAVAEQLATLTRSGLPLPGGLRAASKDITSPAVRAALVHLAEELERGKPLDEILDMHPHVLPTHLAQLMLAGARSGKLPEVLTQLVEIDRADDELRHMVWLTASYPLLLSATFLAVAVFLGMYLTPDLRELFAGFGLRLPLPTRILMWFSGTRLLEILGCVAAAASMSWISFRVLFTAPMRHRFVTRIPLFGPLVMWRALAGWARLLALLLDQGTPAPDALQFTADGTRDANLANESRRLARAVAGGRSLANSLAADWRMPATLAPIVRWGEESGSLGEAIHTAAEFYEERARLRASLLQTALPPITFVVIALGTLAILGAMSAPMIELIRNLSGGY